MRHGALVLSILAVVMLAAREAEAHDVGISRGDYVVAGGVVEARLVFAARDRALVLAGGLPGDLIFVDADESPCRKTDEQVSAAASDAGAADDAVLVHLRFVCPPDAESIVLQAGFVGVATASAEGETHRHLAHVVVVGPPRRELDTVLAAGHERIEIAASGDADAGRAGGFFALLETGIRHVLGGPDHLAFLLALVLESSGAGGLAELLRVATAFTVAHSLTLALATTGLARPPSSWIEPLVALSIAVVAARAVRQTRADRPAPRRSGWPLAFGFGLVHGFAFADALRTLGLHGLALARSLVGFNLGVEAGQLVALAVLVPALAGVSRLVGDRARVVRVVGALLVLAGVVWFVARLRTSFAW